MREAMIAIHHGTGLSAIESPWIAVVPVFVVLALIMFICGRALLFTKQIYVRRPVLRITTAVLTLIVLMSTFLVAVGVTSVVRFGAGVQNHDPFTIYWTVLFLVANVPFWIVLWRGGAFRNVQPNL